MTKYIIMKDYKSGTKLEYVDAKSNDLSEVKKEAEALHTDDVYLTMILEKVGKTETLQDGWKVTHYTDTLEHRRAWWKTTYNYSIKRYESKKYGVVFSN